MRFSSLGKYLCELGASEKPFRAGFPFGACNTSEMKRPENRASRIFRQAQIG